MNETSKEKAGYRIGVIGLGNRSGLAKLAHLPDDGVTVTLGADPRHEARQRFTDRFDEVSTVSNYRELLANPDIDAVFITSSDDLHEEHAIASLEAGKAVFLEKPMAITTAGCDRILITATRTGQKLYVGHNMRHFPVMRKMKELIDDGAIGEPKAAWCRHFVSYGGDAYFKDWHADRSRSTSLLLQKGAHDIDILHWLAGGYTQSVTAMGGQTVYRHITDRHAPDEYGDASFSHDNWPPMTQTGLNPVIDVEDVSMMLMHLDNDVFASYQQCHFTPDSCRNYTIIGTEGRIENDGDIPGNAHVHLWNKRYDGRCDANHSFKIEQITGGHGGADPRLVQEFLEYLRHDAPTETSPIAARMAVAAGCAATESLRNGSQPQVVAPLPAELKV